MKTFVQNSLITLGLLLMGVLVGYALSQEFTGQFNPGVYTIPTVDGAARDVINLQHLLSDPNLSAEQIQRGLRQVAAVNKQGVTIEQDAIPGVNNSTTGVDVIDQQTLGNAEELVDSEGAAEVDDLAGLPDVPSKGYTVGNYTYAGFEPRSVNRNLTETDVAKAGKDWVYRYLLNNNINPNTDWAAAAAAALNAKYGVNVFYASDSVTLVYGDEYVHSAPNGYGLRSNQYDPNAQGEFFWGYQ